MPTFKIAAAVLVAAGATVAAGALVAAGGWVGAAVVAGVLQAANTVASVTNMANTEYKGLFFNILFLHPLVSATCVLIEALLSAVLNDVSRWWAHLLLFQNRPPK